MRPTDALPHPPDWLTMDIGGAIELRRGVSWSKDQEQPSYREGTIPVLRIGNIQRRLELDDLLFISGLGPNAIEKNKVAAGWTLIVGSNGNRQRIGNAVLIKRDMNFLFGSFLLAARPKNTSGISPEYFYRWLMSEPVQAYLSASSEGTTGLSNLSHSFFKQMTIPFPRHPLEQVAIVRLLDAVDAAQESIRTVTARAVNVREALVQHLLERGLRGHPRKKTQIGWLPESWDAVPLSSVVNTFQYGLSVSMDQQGELPILRMGNIQDGDVSLHDMKYLSLPASRTAPYLLQRGDVLFNRVNSQELVGKVGIYRHDSACVFASYLIRLVPNASKIDSYFLGHALSSYPAQCRIKRYATPGVQQVNVNATNLGKVLIPIPNGPYALDEQREIAAILEAARSAVESYRSITDSLDLLRISLMRVLLTGALRLGTRDVHEALQP